MQIVEKHFVPAVQYTCRLVHCCVDLVWCGICTIVLIWYMHYWCMAGWWSAVHQMERGRCPRHPQLIRLPHSKHRPLPPPPRPRPRPRPTIFCQITCFINNFFCNNKKGIGVHLPVLPVAGCHPPSPLCRYSLLLLNTSTA